MRWDKLCCCLAYMSATGSAGGLIYLLFHRMLWKYQLKLHFIQWIIVLFLMPLVYPCLIISHIDYLGDGEWLYWGSVGTEWPESIRWIFIVVSAIWAFGLVVGVLIRLKQYTEFREILKANLPVNASEWVQQLTVCTGKYVQKKIEIYRNPCVDVPLVAGTLYPMIIVPEVRYTAKEKCMITEHELFHIVNRDLLWKKLALVVSWLHWYNPLVYWLIRQLIIEQEINCDMEICDGNDGYTRKEYCEFLYGLESNVPKTVFMSSLVETKSDLERRIEAMANKGNVKYVSKWLALVLGSVLCISSASPVYAAGMSLQNVEEGLKTEGELLVQDAFSDSSQYEEVTIYDEGEVSEIYLDMTNLLSSVISIDTSIPANTRAMLKAQEMVVGDEVSFLIVCSDPDVVFRVGIRNVDTNEMTYVEGKDTLYHKFTVREAGTYRAVIQNISLSTAVFEGSVGYTEGDFCCNSIM